MPLDPRTREVPIAYRNIFRRAVRDARVRISRARTSTRDGRRWGRGNRARAMKQQWNTQLACAHCTPVSPFIINLLHWLFNRAVAVAKCWLDCRSCILFNLPHKIILALWSTILEEIALKSLVLGTNSALERIDTSDIDRTYCFWSHGQGSPYGNGHLAHEFDWWPQA